MLVLSQYVEPHYAMKLVAERRGGVGYLLKERITDVDELTEEATRVAAGRTVIDPAVVAELLARPASRDPLATLSEREREVLALMAQGRSNQAIAARLRLSGKTVEPHVRSIFVRLDLAPEADDHRRVLAVLTQLRGITTEPHTRGNISGNIGGVTVTLSITVDDDLGRDLTVAVAGGNRSALIATAIREYLDRRNIAAAAAWHASLTGDDAQALADFDATW